VVGTGANRLPLTHVTDAARALVHVAGLHRHDIVGRINLAIDGADTTQRELLGLTSGAMGVKRASTPGRSREPTISRHALPYAQYDSTALNRGGQDEEKVRVIKAVVFDMDGVLIDSEEVWSRVRAAVVARHGGHWTEDDQRNVMGDNSRQWSAYIKRTWNLSSSEDEIFREVLAMMIASYEQELPVLPGAREAVALLGKRYPLAVASSSPRELILVALRLAGFAGDFTVVVSSDEVPHGKPAPDVYLLAAEKLGVAPVACLAIEDSTNGIRAALAAGMKTIAVPNPAYPPAEDALAQATLVLPSLKALSEATIEALDAA
jgi:HAD superfamily hydrolase (TIGR01509 family)